MKLIIKILVYGFLVWLIPFVISILIFPLKDSLPSLFESIMPVAVVVCVVIFSILYFRKVGGGVLGQAIVLGTI